MMFPRIYTVLLIGLSALLLFVAGAVFYSLITPPRQSTPPFEWVNVSTTPIIACPGERVSYDLYIDVHRPGAFFVSSSWRRADTHPDVEAVAQSPEIQAMQNTFDSMLVGDTIVFQYLGNIPVLNIDKAGLLVDQDAGLVVPADLTPGEYVRVVVAGELFSNAAHSVRTQQVMVPDDCPPVP